MIRVGRKYVLGTGVALLLLAGACSDGGSDQPESVGEVQSALSRSYTISLPRWAPLSDVVVGPVVSRQKVTIRSYGHATSVTTAATLEIQAGGSTSSLEQNADLSLPAQTTLNFSFADTSQGNREAFTRGPVVNLKPNRYGNCGGCRADRTS
jgi:hypothetical protein